MAPYAVRGMRHFGARYLVGKSYPGLRHAEPKSLVSVGFGRARHRYTLLNQMLVNSDLHCAIPFVRCGSDVSSGVRQRFDPQMAECGRSRLRQGDETVRSSSGTIRRAVLTARRSARSARVQSACDVRKGGPRDHDDTSRARPLGNADQRASLSQGETPRDRCPGCLTVSSEDEV